MLHHLLPCLRVRSAKIRVQRCPSHARMLAKSSSQTHLANASPIGSNRDSGDRQSRIVCSSKRSPSLSGRKAMRLNISSRSRSAFRGPSSRIAFGVSGRPMCFRTKPLNHSRKARAWSATSSSSPGVARSVKAFSACARNKVGLSQPRDETVAAVEPVNRRIDRRRDGIQEIEARRVGNEICRRSRRHNSA